MRMYDTTASGTATYTGIAYRSAHAYSAAANVHDTTTRESVNNTAAMDMNGLAHNNPSALDTTPLGSAMMDCDALAPFDTTPPGVRSKV